MKQKYFFAIILFLILILASFLRLWRLDSIPPGIYPDEAINGNEAWQAVQTDNYKIFYPDNNGREGLWINIIAMVFKFIAPPSPFSLRLPSVIFGILTIWGIYFLAKELFGEQFSGNKDSRWIGLAASFFTAVSFWHLNFSRIAFRGIMVPLLMSWGIYFLLKGWRKKYIFDFIMSGLIIGLGFHTYIAFRFVPLIILIYIILITLEYWQSERAALIKLSFRKIWRKIYLKDNWWLLSFWLMVIFLTALPIGFYFFQYPEDFIGRAQDVSIFSQENPLLVFGKSLLKTLAMFNFQGDFNWRHNFSGSPQLFWPVGLLFILGIIISLKNLFTDLKKRLFPLIIPNLLLISWFVIMLLPSLLTTEGLPHALRSIGVIPVVYIYAALGIVALYNWLVKNSGSLNKGAIIIALFLFAVWLTNHTFNQYFISWANNPEVKSSFTEKFVRIGEILNNEPNKTKRFVIVNESGVLVNGIPMPAQTVMFATINHPQAEYLLPQNIGIIKKEKGEKIVIPLKSDRQLLEQAGLIIEEKNGILIGR